MSDQPGADPTPALWRAAVDALGRVEVPGDTTVAGIPAPTRLAPYAAAFSGDIRPGAPGDASPAGTGRFVLLHDPEGIEAWGGPFRVVCFAKAPLEADLGLDPFLADVAWAWLIDALDEADAEYSRAAGTATKTINTGYGEIATSDEGTEMEVRASWSPGAGDLGPHFAAWIAFLRQLSGIPPLPIGVAAIETRRRALQRHGHGE